MALASPQWFNPWFNPPKRPAALTQTAMSHGKTHPYQTIWYHALLSPSVIDYIHHIISYHIISYHIIAYHLPIFSGSPPIFLAFPPDKSTRTATLLHIAPRPTPIDPIRVAAKIRTSATREISLAIQWYNVDGTHLKKEEEDIIEYHCTIEIYWTYHIMKSKRENDG